MFGAFVLLIFLMLAGLIALIILYLRAPEGFAPIISRVRALLSSYAMRIALAALLSILLLIPLGMIKGLIDERANYQRAAIASVVSDWGRAQRLTGPMLLVPYSTDKAREVTYLDEDGKKRLKTVIDTISHSALVLPDTLDMTGRLLPEVRKRGIYEANVYTAQLKLQTTFPAVDMAKMDPAPTRVDWASARLVMGVADPRGIVAGAKVTGSGLSTALELLAGTEGAPVGSGFSALVPAELREQLQAGTARVGVALSLRGSEKLDFVPIGETTRVEFSSDWPSPSFMGAMLPEKREISSEGFTAQWAIPHLARSFPQVMVDAGDRRRSSMAAAASGVRLVEPVWLYSKTERAVKYGFLFIGLSFLTLLMIEYALKFRLHLVQYAVIGGALTLVYLLILSLAEHIGFAAAYIAASATMVLLVAGYAHAAQRRWKLTLWIGLVLSALYGVMYTLLNLEDYALLVGTLLLLLFLVAIMALTRRLVSATPQGTQATAVGANAAE